MIPIVRLLRAVVAWRDLQKRIQAATQENRSAFAPTMSPRQIASERGAAESELCAACDAWLADVDEHKKQVPSATYRKGDKL